jgi:hypothetical protein
MSFIDRRLHRNTEHRVHTILLDPDRTTSWFRMGGFWWSEATPRGIQNVNAVYRFLQAMNA